MGFLFTQKKETIVAIFDIGSGSVGGAIAHIPKDKKGTPVIIKSIVNDIKFHKGFDSSFDSFMQDMTTTLSETATALYDKKVGAPDEIFCVFASPWYLSETRSIKMSREKSFTFTKRIASDLIEKEISSLTDLYKSKYGTLDSIPQVIEQNTMSVSLNGYPMEEPLGKECKSIEMNMVISLSPKLCLDKIRETISKTYHHKSISFSSFTLASYLAVRDKYINSDSYLLIDVRGEITDVGIVTKGILKSVLSFPFGKKTFFKYICTKLEIELRDAQELFKLYSEGHLSEEFKNKVVPLFKSIESSWSEAFGQCISTLPRTLVLPGVVFLTADSDIKSWFADVLKNEKHIQSTATNNKCTVITLDGSEFLNMCNIKEGGCDPFLMIEAIAIMRKIAK
jgi:hypothetical protein